MILAFKHTNNKVWYLRVQSNLIKWWTKSKYYHVEIIIDNKWISSHTKNGLDVIDLKPLNDINYDYFELNTLKLTKAQETIFWDWVYSQIGTGYDWVGIWLSQFANLNWHSKNKWFCSEVGTKILQLNYVPELFEHNPNSMSPGDIFKLLEHKLKELKEIKEIK